MSNTSARDHECDRRRQSLQHDMPPVTSFNFVPPGLQSLASGPLQQLPPMRAFDPHQQELLPSAHYPYQLSYEQNQMEQHSRLVPQWDYMTPGREMEFRPASHHMPPLLEDPPAASSSGLVVDSGRESLSDVETTGRLAEETVNMQRSASTSSLSTADDVMKARATSKRGKKGKLRSEEGGADAEGSRGSGRYACEYCSKKFSRPSSLKIHIHSHTGERPFECPNCGRSFSVQSNLKRHMKVHDPNRPPPRNVPIPKEVNGSEELHHSSSRAILPSPLSLQTQNPPPQAQLPLPASLSPVNHQPPTMYGRLPPHFDHPTYNDGRSLGSEHQHRQPFDPAYHQSLMQYYNQSQPSGQFEDSSIRYHQLSHSANDSQRSLMQDHPYFRPPQ